MSEALCAWSPLAAALDAAAAVTVCCEAGEAVQAAKAAVARATGNPHAASWVA